MAIKSGFFHAVKTGNTYDRVYNADDHNKFFEGVIAQNGVLRWVKGTLMPSNYLEDVDVEIDGQILENRIQVVIKPGKAFVNGHWFISDDEESVYLSPRPLGTGYRVDMISLRWNDGERNVSFHVTEGGITNTKPTLENYPLPLGYIPDPMSRLLEEGYTEDQINKSLINPDTKGFYNTDVYFEPVIDETTGDQVLEIALGYVIIPSNVTGGDIEIISSIGDTKCPYIAFTAGPYGDAYAAQYNTEILEWWDGIKQQGDMNLVINVIRQKFAGARSSTILFSEIPLYTYHTTDTINIYYNGLFVDEDEWEFVVESDEVVGIKLHNGSSQIPADNSATLEIFVGPSIDIPDGSTFKY